MSVDTYNGIDHHLNYNKSHSNDMVMNNKDFVPYMNHLSLKMNHVYHRYNKTILHTSFKISFTLTIKRIQSINAMCIILWTNNTFTIIDICLTSMTSKTWLTCTTKHNIIFFKNRMTLSCII
jgi:hypothetical protein